VTNAFKLIIINEIIIDKRIRAEFEESIGQLLEMGYQVAATPGTAEYYINKSGSISTSTEGPGYSSLFANIVSLSKPTDDQCLNSNLCKSFSMEISSSASDVSINLGNSFEKKVVPVIGSVLDWIKDKKIDLVINIPEGSNRRDEVTSGYLMRRAAVDFGTSLLTNIKYITFMNHLFILTKVL
jgi:hypothetical protein